MKPSLFWIRGPWRGRLGISARPRGGDWLDDEAESWRQAGIDLVVSLLEPAEVGHFNLEGEATSTAAHGLRFKSQPIPDRGVPKSRRSIEDLARELHGELDRGKTVMIHCRQGIGRSALIAAAILILSGQTASDAIKAISTARGLEVPETDAQRNWIDEFAMSRAK
jgi:protein-tyrosine phosphatase